MNFEHLIEINDASEADIPPLSRSQLWHGLVVRAQRPQLFVIGLDQCTILEQGEDFIERELLFGRFRVRDRVSFVEQQAVIYEVQASPKTPASRLTMAIEEPEPGQLYVRFVYADRDIDSSAQLDGFVALHLKQAYIHADIDTIAVIRRLAAEGILMDEVPTQRLN